MAVLYASLFVNKVICSNKLLNEQLLAHKCVIHYIPSYQLVE